MSTTTSFTLPECKNKDCEVVEAPMPFSGTMAYYCRTCKCDVVDSSFDLVKEFERLLAEGGKEEQLTFEPWGDYSPTITRGWLWDPVDETFIPMDNGKVN